MALAQSADNSSSDGGSFQPLPSEAYVQPIYDGAETERELWRAREAGGMSEQAFNEAMDRLAQAKSDAERLEIVDIEHLKSPASPAPDVWHRDNCDCHRHGAMALQPTITIIPI